MKACRKKAGILDKLSGKAKERLALAKCREYHDAVFMWRMFRGGALPHTLDELEAPLDAADRRDFVRLDPNG